MFNATAVASAIATTNTTDVPTGRLLINDADEIIYANKQARNFLGLLSDETIQAEQKLLPLLHQSYQFHAPTAWHDWPKRPFTRYLIYKSPHNMRNSLLKVEIIEHILLGDQNIWAVAITLVETTKSAEKQLAV